MPLEILLVDDDALIRDGIQPRLCSLGYSVTCAADGADALVQIERSRFDAVITDILMPRIDGLELIAVLRRTQPEVRIVAMSAGGKRHPSHYLESAAGLGAHATLLKPFSFSELKTALCTAIG